LNSGADSLIPYWLLLAWPIWGCLKGADRRWTGFDAALITFVLTLFVGLRHEIGGDWFNYLPYLDRAQGLPLVDVIAMGDVGYNLLNWSFANVSWGIYGVNTVCAAVFAAGLVVFCKAQPRPWLALALAIPYLVIVVAMGYTRQAVALGLVMPALLALEQGKVRAYVAYLAAAATFHATVLVMLAFVVPAVPGRTLAQRALRIALLVFVGAALVATFLISRLESLTAGYLEAQYQSEGAAIRVAMIVVPALVLLLWRKRFDLSERQRAIWLPMALVAFACAGALLLLPGNSTAVDRIALYVIPLQLFVGSRVPGMKLVRCSPIQLTLLVIAVVVSIQVVWLNFAVHAEEWLPYENLLFFSL